MEFNGPASCVFWEFHEIKKSQNPTATHLAGFSLSESIFSSAEFTSMQESSLDRRLSSLLTRARVKISSVLQAARRNC